MRGSLWLGLAWLGLAWLCGVRGIGQEANLLFLVRSALDLRFQVGEVRQDRVDRNVSEVVEVGKRLEVTVKEQQEQGRV